MYMSMIFYSWLHWRECGTVRGRVSSWPAHKLFRRKKVKQICINSVCLPESQQRLRGPGTVADLSHSPFTLRSQVCHILSSGVRQNKLSFPQCWWTNSYSSGKHLHTYIHTFFFIPFMYIYKQIRKKYSRVLNILLWLMHHLMNHGVKHVINNKCSK